MRLSLLLSAFALIWLFSNESAIGQISGHVSPTRIDRSQWAQPDDPQHRGWFWRKQTGHAGRFYDCQDEHQKRHLPWICWNQNGSPFTGFSIRQTVLEDIFAIRQRIDDGATVAARGVKLQAKNQQCQCRKCRSKR